MIPKVIYYCWFGKKEKSKNIIENIQTWKLYFPDYEIIEMNESNTDLEECDYVRQAYAKQKWAFVSDYVRMKVLYEEGGIYFDTDVEVIKKFPEKMFNTDAFTGFESGSMLVSPGLVFACKRHHPFVKKMLESYQNDSFVDAPAKKMCTINKRITKLLTLSGLVLEDKIQKVEEVTVYPSRFFCGYDPQSRQVMIEPETVCVHHYNASWFPWYKKVKFQLGTIVRRTLFRIKKRG